MNIFNLNTLQSVLTFILATLPVILVNLGCTVDGAGKIDCSTAITAPTTLGYVAAAIGFLKLFVIPLLQPGGLFRNLFAPKVPVSTSGDTGTVSPNAVKP